MTNERLVLFPETSKIAENGRLSIGGCDVAALAERHGTPLYLFDEATVRGQCRAFRREFESRYPDSQAAYASKAYIDPVLATIIKQEGLGLDVVSGGEISIARNAGCDPCTTYFHGNNKGPEEVEMAVDWPIGRIVIDNFHELSLVDAAARKANRRQGVLMRVSPGIDPHTHHYTTTGIIDSKFGFPIVTGAAEQALRLMMGSSGLDLLGLHFHLGSPIFETQPYVDGMETVLRFAAEMKRKHGFEMKEFSPGGGFAVRYLVGKPAPPVSDYAETIVSALKDCCGSLGLSLPRLIVEPGRAIVARAGVAVYRVGGRKSIPGVRDYIFLDGGMADNIRPALYGSEYECLLANRAGAGNTQKVTLGGKFCESGDILIKDIELPAIDTGDLVAVPVCGAYCLSMASNYNLSVKPPILLVNAGKADVIRRRETHADLRRLARMPRRMRP